MPPVVSELVSRWFLPVSGELRLGGRYQFEGNAGGTIEECDPPEHVRATWEYGGQASWVTLRLEADGGGTRLLLEHEAFVDPEFMGRFGPGAVGVGWDLGFLGLAKHIEDPAASRPEAGGWETSPEAMGFYRRASEAWGQGAIEAGTPADEATAAADNTRAFYSGEGPGAAGSEAEEASTS